MATRAKPTFTTLSLLTRRMSSCCRPFQLAPRFGHNSKEVAQEIFRFPSVWSLKDAQRLSASKMYSHQGQVTTLAFCVRCSTPCGISDPFTANEARQELARDVLNALR